MGTVVTAMQMLVQVAASAGQATPPARPPASRPPEPGDIVVEGYRLRPDVATQVLPQGKVSAQRSRITYDYAERMAKCAARSRLSDLSRLRAVVDGEVNTAVQRSAQDRLVRTYVTCGESPSFLNFSSTPQGAAESGEASPSDESPLAGTSLSPSIAPLGQSVYDRGAFTIQALKSFAPDLKLSRKETEDGAVQARFNLREGPRNRARLPEDFFYYEVAVCMVRVEPRLAVRLALSGGPARAGDLQAALIDRARVCVGGAKNVRADATQFRLYIADAVYRWAVAARGVETLIPDRPLAAEVSPDGGSSPS